MALSPVIEILVVGDEIISEPARDRNSQFMVGELANAGFAATYITITGDAPESLTAAVHTAGGRADIILVTGGLGPTSDDRTVEVLAGALGRDLVEHSAVLAHIESIFRSRNRPFSESNRKQALLPTGAEALDNPEGTAPGITLTDGHTTWFLMPGVPGEMQAIFRESVLPRIASRWESTPVKSALLKAFGISESALFDAIRDLPGVVDHARFYPAPDGMTVKILTHEGDPLDADLIRDNIRDRLDEFVYATSDTTLAAVIGQTLTERKLTLATAESCTGGSIGDRITDIPGSSAYYLGGVIAYANDVKTRCLGVPDDLIRTHGAVSEEVAAAMASGVREKLGADMGLATTGIAGPGGGSDVKPVGLVWIALADSTGVITKRLQFFPDRRINKTMMSQAALMLLRHVFVRIR